MNRPESGAPPLVLFDILNPRAELPRFATEGSAGLDLKCLDGFTLNGGCRELVGTGLAVAIPPGHVGLVCPRSGLALNHGITVLNAPGVIDSDYRGELKVIVHNTSPIPVRFDGGDRIAQLVIVPVVASAMIGKASLTQTARGAGGFGSTGS